MIGYGSSASIVTDYPTQFTLSAAGNWYSFTMPQDSTIDNLYGDISTVSNWTPASNVTLYLAIATAPSGSNTFTIIPSSVTPISVPYFQGTQYPAYTSRTASATGLDISVTSGTRVMIIGGMLTSGGTQALTLPFSYTGGMSLR
jgi:hypothetical protein